MKTLSKLLILSFFLFSFLCNAQEKMITISEESYKESVADKIKLERQLDSILKANKDLVKFEDSATELRAELNSKDSLISSLNEEVVAYKEEKDSLQNLINPLNESIAALKAEKESLENQLNLLKEEKSTITTTRDSLQNKNKVDVANINQLNKQVFKLNNSVENLEKKNNALIKQNKDYQRQIKKEFPKLIANKKEEVESNLNAIESEENLTPESIAGAIDQLNALSIDFFEEEDEVYKKHQSLIGDYEVYLASNQLLMEDIDTKRNKEIIEELENIETTNTAFQNLITENLKAVKNYCKTYVITKIWFDDDKINDEKDQRLVDMLIEKLKKDIAKNYGSYPLIEQKLDEYTLGAANPFLKEPPLKCN